jgi:hypothetical protein
VGLTFPPPTNITRSLEFAFLGTEVENLRRSRFDHRGRYVAELSDNKGGVVPGPLSVSEVTELCKSIAGTPRFGSDDRVSREPIFRIQTPLS